MTGSCQGGTLQAAGDRGAEITLVMSEPHDFAETLRMLASTEPQIRVRGEERVARDLASFRRFLAGMPYGTPVLPPIPFPVVVRLLLDVPEGVPTPPVETLARAFTRGLAAGGYLVSPDAVAAVEVAVYPVGADEPAGMVVAARLWRPETG